MMKLSEFLLSELDKRGLSYKKAGKLMHDRHGMNIFNAINRQGRIREDFALRFEKAFGVSALLLLVINVKERLEALRKRKITKEELRQVLTKLTED